MGHCVPTKAENSKGPAPRPHQDMNEHLNITLALAKQAYEELTHLAPLLELEKCEFGSGSKRDRIAELLKTLNTSINTIRRILSDHVKESSEAPILSVPPAHRTFYNDVIIVHGSSLQRAYFEIAGLSFLIDVLERSTGDKPKPRILNAMSWALERWDDMLDDDEAYDWYQRGFDINGALESVAMPWFAPDEWKQNLKILQPVLLDRAPQVLRDHVRYRLTETYRAFAYGLWMAAIALSRSLVEFSIKANAPRLGIDITYTASSGLLEDKTLKRLGEDIARVLPALANAIETVRESGNRILHPKKRDVIAHPRVMRAEALDCIRATTLIVETLYSEISPAQ